MWMTGRIPFPLTAVAVLSLYHRSTPPFWAIPTSGITLCGQNTSTNLYGELPEGVRRFFRKKWRIVAAHHPIYAYGGHGHHSGLEKTLLKPLCKHADIYLAGHEHNLQHLQAPCGLPLVVSGGAAKMRRTKYGKLTKFAKSVRGYVHLEVSPKNMQINFFDDTSQQIYELSLRRNS